jgi:hypothetical protein
MLVTTERSPSGLMTEDMFEARQTVVWWMAGEGDGAIID